MVCAGAPASATARVRRAAECVRPGMPSLPRASDNEASRAANSDPWQLLYWIDLGRTIERRLRVGRLEARPEHLIHVVLQVLDVVDGDPQQIDDRFAADFHRIASRLRW